MLIHTDTIVAISTPPGRGGIGIVRLSGPQAREIAQHLCQLRHPLRPALARYGHILDLNGIVLDEIVATWFAAPHSYTTEDLVEIACHGSPVLLDYLVRASLEHGARLAQPGEFTQRAFLAGRLDLTQAEAVNDLIASQTLHQARVAAAQLGGSVAREIAPAKHALIRLIAEMEAGIDFAEDDLDLTPQAEIVQRLASVHADLSAIAATYQYGRLVREGFTLAIVGRPNAGKSSLFNRLLERERAIVTAQPGTTRDPISERLSLAGVPVELIDTAGLREAPTGPEGEAETQGIQRTRLTMAEADLVIHVIDATVGFHAEDRATQQTLFGRPSQIVWNKSDLASAGEGLDGVIQTSARTGEGLEQLKQAILKILTQSLPAGDGALLTNLRQHQTISEAVASLARAMVAARNGFPHEMLLLDLYAGLEALGSLTGATSSDDILNLIFSTFCIGK